MPKPKKKLISFRLQPKFIEKIDELRFMQSLGTRTNFIEAAAEAYIKLFNEGRAGFNGE